MVDPTVREVLAAGDGNPNSVSTALGTGPLPVAGWWHAGLRGAWWSVATAVVWVVLASLNPTTTYPLAPLLVAATVVSVPGGVLVAFVASWLLAARHA